MNPRTPTLVAVDIGVLARNLQAIFYRKWTVMFTPASW
jgi:hypothetical protein